MIITRQVLLLFVFILIQTNSFAQDDFRFIHYNETNGLDARINDIGQDQYGYIWIASSGGPFIYDGYSFKILADTLIGKDVWCFVFQDSLNYWISSTQNGLIHYNPYSEKVRIYSENADDPYAIQNNYIEDVIETSSGDILCGNWNGFSIYIPEKDGFKNFKLPNQQGNNACVLTILEDSQHNFWMGTWGGFIYKLDKNYEIVRTYSNEASDPNRLNKDRIKDIIEDKDGNIWIGTWDGGVCRLNESTNNFECLNTQQNKFGITLENNRIHQITEHNEKLWIGSESGLLIFNPLINHLEVLKPKDLDRSSLSEIIVTCAFFDHQKGLWLGSPTSGLNYYNPFMSRFLNFSRLTQLNSKLPSNSIKGLFEAEDEKVWIGTNDGSVVFDLKSHSINTFDNLNINFPNTHQITAGLRNNHLYYVGTDQGIVAYNRMTNQYRLYSLEEYNFTNIQVSSLHITPDSNLIITVGGRGIFYLDLKTGKYNRLSNSDHSLLINMNKRYLLSEGSIAIGIFDKEKKSFAKEYSTKNDATYKQFAKSVEDLTPKNDSVIRVWTKNYLYEFNWLTGQVIDSIDFRKDLPQFDISTVLMYSQEEYWIASSIGLIKVNLQTEKSQLFNENDGVIRNSLRRTKLFPLSTGEIILTTLDGFSLFNPQKIKLDTTSHPFYFTGLKINDQQIKYDPKGILSVPIRNLSRLTLKHDQNTLEFNFTLLSYALSEKNKYRYILNGFQDEWSEPQYEPSLKFQNLSFGEYILQIEAANHDGVWIAKSNPVKIRIKPPYYLTWWFISLSILFVIVVVRVVIKIRERQLKHDKMILESKIKEGEAKIEKQSQEVENQRLELQKRDREQREEKWYNEGMIKLNGVLSENRNNLKDLCRNALNAIIDYINADQGGIFVINDEDENNLYLEMISSFAYNKERLEKTNFMIGEGEVGVCFKDGELIHIEDVPDTYSKVESGLGAKKPKNILIIPIILDDIKVGVLELASFKSFKDHHTRFLSDLGRNLTSYIFSIKTQEKMEVMLMNSKKQAEELASQEEELRQNLEEMEATQEESARREETLKKQNKVFEKKELKLERIMHDIESAHRQTKTEYDELIIKEKKLQAKIKKLETELKILKDQSKNS